MNDLKAGLRAIIFFKRDYKNMTDEMRLQIFACYVSLCSMALQGFVDGILSIGYDMRIAGPAVGFVVGALCYFTLSSWVRRRTNLSVGISGGYLIFTVVFTLMGFLGALTVGNHG